MKIKQYSLDHRAIQHQKVIIQMDENLSGFISNNVDFDTGRIFTFAPENIEKKRLYDFEWAILENINPKIKKYDEKGNLRGTWQQIPGDITPYFVDYVQKHMQKNTPCIGLRRSGWARITDPWYKKQKAKDIYCSIEEMLHNYFIPEMKQIKFEESLCWGTDFALEYGIVSTDMSIKELLDKGEYKIPQDELELICKNITLIFVGAYDGEGYLI